DFAAVAAVAALSAAVVYLAARARGPAASPAGRLVAILPFRDLSNVRDGSLIGEGLVETVSARLGGATGMQVVSPAAVVAAAAGDSDPARVARSLGAAVYLRGSVQRSEDRVRITYSLFDAARGVELSGGTLDGSASEIFDLQDRLVARVSEAESMPVRRAAPPTGLEAAGQQERYLKAVGLLQHYNTKASVDEAVAILEPLANDAPRSPYVFASLARARLAEFDLTHDPGMVPKAEEAAARARTLDPGLVEVDVTLGELRLHTGNAAGAAEAFRRALSTSATNFDARLGLARALGAARRDAEAERAFREAIALQPTYWGGYSKLAGFYYTRGRYPEAAGAFARVTELTPDNALAFSNLGGAWFQAGDLEKALAAFRRSLALQPTGFAWSNIGTAQFFLGDYAKAADAFQQAAKLTPDVYRVWANLGDALRWQSGRSDDARAAYLHAIDLCRRELARDPDDGVVRSILASSLAKTGNGRDADGEIRKAATSAPSDPDVAYQTAVVRTIAGDRAGALDALSRAVQSGYPRTLIEKDPELSALRADPRYPSAVGAGNRSSL
ncbi:MAG TPA: tetratricopeptide repeat protein, partial [Thermoanaerobaculia bacterium]|nr:tetratricopeptide repeat protein [Thermoanaerobaculia bacterium]